MNIHAQFAPLVLKLLQGPLYDDDKLWPDLERQAVPVRHYLTQIGLLLHLNSEQGFAYLRQETPDEETELRPLPRLVQRRKLSFELTMLCVVIRHMLDLFDKQNVQETKCIVSKQALLEELSVFFPDRTDKSKLQNKAETLIHKAEEEGFLRLIKTKGFNSSGPEYEIKRIITDLIPVDKLKEIRDKLYSHLNQEPEPVAELLTIENDNG